MSLDPSLWTPHPRRETVLAEVHARPFRAMQAPARLLRFAFMASPEEAASARARIAELCVAAGVSPPPPEAKQHRARLAGADGAPVDLAFEQHGEFVSYSFVMANGETPFDPPAIDLARRLPDIGLPGRHVVSADIALMRPAGVEVEAIFDPLSLAAASMKDGAAVVATDFRPDAEGFVRWLVVNAALDDNAAGALAQRVAEIETYRTLALLGLPEAQRLAPRTARIENELTDISADMTRSENLDTDGRLLDRLSHLAADLEADTASSAFRFGATRAYDELVAQRLQAAGESALAQWPTITSFLDRRSAPAMRTCRAIEARQARLSEKLTRATNLLRTRVDVAIEQQNSKLLNAMNERASMQLRLQQTVEGLSVAAISYYVVGLAGYVFKAAKDAGAPLDPGVAMGVSVPLAVLLVWWLVRRIRKRHSEH